MFGVKINYNHESVDIWDIDNCLADDQWRQELVDWELKGDARYYRYNEQLCKDHAAHTREFELYRRLGAKPVFFTGRAEYLRKDTESWLELRLHLKPGTYRIFMRPNGTEGLTPRTLKERMLLEFLSSYPHAKIIAAFDDIPAVVDMYRSYDVPAARLAIHSDLTGAYQPSDLK